MSRVPPFSKGELFELMVYKRVKQLVAKGLLGLTPKQCKVFHKKYYTLASADNDKVQADVSLEFLGPGAQEPMLIFIWECKHHSRRVGKASLKKFLADIHEIGASRVKGFVVTSIGFTRWAKKYAATHGIGLWRLEMPQDWHKLDDREFDFTVVSAMDPGIAGVGSLLILFLIFQRWIWYLVFGIGSLASCFFMIVSILHSEILKAVAYLFLMLICWGIARVIDG